MKKLYILTLFICLAGFGNSFAQTLKGHIYDANTNEPLVGAAVTYKLHGNQGTVSDINGAYEIKLPEGGVDLVFSYIGYEDVLMPIVIGKREVITKDVYMKESTKLLEEVVVSAGRFEQKLSNVTVSMDLVKAGDIARQAPTDITSTLRTLPGVDIVDKQPSMRGGSGWTYGVGARSQILVDGMSTLNPKTGEINWNTVPLENIEQIEVIKGASSVLYGSSALNGIINIRTARPGLTPKPASAPISVYMVMPKTMNTNGATRVSGKTTSIPSNPSCAETFSAAYETLFMKASISPTPAVSATLTSAEALTSLPMRDTVNKDITNVSAWAAT